jgi:dihydrofolate reductase
MAKPKISIICAVAENLAIGKNNQLLWHIPEDFKRFKELTDGHVVVMGENTFNSLNRPLEGRVNIVISQNPDFEAPGAIVFHSIDEAIGKARKLEKREIFIIGGGQIYRQTIGLADKLYLTVVEGNFEADTFFPDYSEFKKIVFEKEGSDGNYKYKFLELTR